MGVRGAAAAATAAAVLAAGCSSTSTAGNEPAPTPTASPSATQAGAHAHDDATTPPTAAGPLSIDSFPAPERLGAGWAYRVDAGDPEAGYIGNGTPGLERDPEEVAMLAVPLGCPRDEELPVAEHAFEVDYSYDERPVIAVRLAFDRPRTAAAFMSARHQDLRSCVGLSGGPAVGPYVAQVRGPLNDRTPESEPWTELVVRRGSGVLLMAVQGSLGEEPFTAEGVRRVQQIVRQGT